MTADGGTSPLTPCSDQIQPPSGFTWTDYGKLSPDDQRLTAQLYSPGGPPITVVFQYGQEIERYSGFGYPDWIDDETLVLIGSKLVTAGLGEEPVIISDDVTEPALRNVDVSPDES